MNNDEFLKLRKIWYQKLKEDGFKDIEYTNWKDGSSGNLLKGFGHMDAIRFYRYDKRRYYQVLSQYANDLEEADHPDAAVVRLHADGLSRAKISKQLGIKEWRINRIVKAAAEDAISSYQASDDPA